MSGDYLRYKVDGKYKVDGADLSDPSMLGVPYKAETEIEEWQLALTAGYKMDKITPYGGLKYSDVSLETEVAWDDPVGGPSKVEQEFDSDKNFGIFAGVDIDIIKNLGVNIEGRVIDETALTVGVKYKF